MMKTRLKARIVQNHQITIEDGLKIRAAEKQEIGWINDCYDQVEFMHSYFDREIIGIAPLNGEKAGLVDLSKWMKKT